MTDIRECSVVFYKCSGLGITNSQADRNTLMWIYSLKNQWHNYVVCSLSLAMRIEIQG
ncbi:hypothetical protein DAI22_11g132600 [Oryza sativa Japonica Group]|nr:hypothetical protein DAI22_11g132600 [Oryza sativa Japonica Group]